MGLERVASVIQGAPSNFETDELAAITRALHELVSARTGATVAYNPHQPCPATRCGRCTRGATSDVRSHVSGGTCDVSFYSASRVVADHLRAAAWLVAEGVVPSNVGRGYVLRRIVRCVTHVLCCVGWCRC